MALLEKKNTYESGKMSQLYTWIWLFVCVKNELSIWNEFLSENVIVRNNNLIKMHLYKPERKEIYVDKFEFISALCCNFLH